MLELKTGIPAKEIMDKNFLILDCSLPLLDCIKKLNKKYEAGIIIKNGKFIGVLSYDDILRGFIYGNDKKAKIEDIKIEKKFAIVSPNSDIFQTLDLMKKENIDFVLVKDKNLFLGLITKKEITDIEADLIEEFTEGRQRKKLQLDSCKDNL